MKTVESYTKEELGKILVDFALLKINHWAKSELNYIRYSLNKPLLIPINDNLWVIGEYVIYNIDNHKYKVLKDKILIHTFYSKKAAVLYAAFNKIKNYKTADKILHADTKVSRLHDECEFFYRKINSKGRKDSFRLDLWLNRYKDYKMQLVPAKIDLEKTLGSAKYMKIWETLL